MSNKVLVTGGTGFLGAYILQALVQRGMAVRALRRTNQVPFFLPPAIAAQVEWVSGDVLDVVALEDAMQQIDSVVHAAAVVSFHQSDNKLMMQVNVEGTANVVNMAIDAGVRRLVHVSSVAALGRTTRNETVSESRKWTPGSGNTPYGLSKHLAEMEVWRGFAEGLEGVIANPSTILGFGNWNQSSCAIFKNAYRAFPWYSGGTNGFVGVEDAAEATVRLLCSNLHGKRFIVSAENIAFRELLNWLADGFGKKRPHLRATPFLGGLAWRLEALKALVGGTKPLLTAETAKVAQCQTRFDNTALLEALPDFRYTPVQSVVQRACVQYQQALNEGLLSL